MSDVTRLLQKANASQDPKAEEALLNAVYKELRIIAQGKMKHERPGHTLQATILVHDAWKKLCSGDKPLDFANRGHFFKSAARAMRQVLVDHARRKLAIKRGERPPMTELQAKNIEDLQQVANEEMVEAVNEVLNEVESEEPVIVKLVELRFFVGLTMPEVAEAMGMSLSSTERMYRDFKKKYKSRFEAVA